MRLARTMPIFDTDLDGERWLRRVLVNAARDRLRSELRRRTREARSMRERRSGAATEAVDDSVEIASLARRLARLELEAAELLRKRLARLDARTHRPGDRAETRRRRWPPAAPACAASTRRRRRRGKERTRKPMNDSHDWHDANASHPPELAFHDEPATSADDALKAEGLGQALRAMRHARSARRRGASRASSCS